MNWMSSRQVSTSSRKAIVKFALESFGFVGLDLLRSQEVDSLSNNVRLPPAAPARLHKCSIVGGSRRPPDADQQRRRPPTSRLHWRFLRPGDARQFSGGTALLVPGCGYFPPLIRRLRAGWARDLCTRQLDARQLSRPIHLSSVVSHLRE
jgi:hypothetical protein